MRRGLISPKPLLALLCALAVGCPVAARAQQGFSCGGPSGAATPQGFVCNLFSPFVTVVQGQTGMPPPTGPGPMIISSNPDPIPSSYYVGTTWTDVTLALFSADGGRGKIIFNTFNALVGGVLSSVVATGTLSNPGALPNNFQMVDINGRGHLGAGGWSMGPDVFMRFFTTQQWAPGAAGTDIGFGTTKNGDNTTPVPVGMLFTQLGTLSFPNTYHLSPVVSSCGSGPAGAIDAAATANSGTVTVGGGVIGTCTVTFNVPFTTSNHCQVTSQATLGAFGYTYTLAAITVTATSLAADVFDYHCDGI